MKPDMRDALLLVHRANIDRYRKLLKTDLTVTERNFIERRLGEEEEELLEIAQRAARLDFPNSA